MLDDTAMSNFLRYQNTAVRFGAATYNWFDSTQLEIGNWLTVGAAIWSQLIWPFSHFAVLIVSEEGIGMGKTCASVVLQLCIIFAVLKFGQNVRVPMKVVDEPVNYEYASGSFCLNRNLKV
jgi:hypothetical protein